jgi:hypothetical protein
MNSRLQAIEGEQVVVTADTGKPDAIGATKLTKYDAACRALAEAYRVDEVKDVRDKALAMQIYAKQAKDSELLDHATEIRKRAEIRAGELLREMGERRGGNQTHRDGSLPSNKEMGITDNQSSRWQQIAALPTDEQEALIEHAKKTAVAAVEKGTKKQKAPRRAARGAEPVPATAPPPAAPNPTPSPNPSTPLPAPATAPEPVPAAKPTEPVQLDMLKPTPEPTSKPADTSEAKPTTPQERWENEIFLRMSTTTSLTGSWDATYPGWGEFVPSEYVINAVDSIVAAWSKIAEDLKARRRTDAAA